MKVVILAGGFGTRLSEESRFRPKPMVEIGGEPILWHIMKLYSHYGFQDFVICAGYKQQIIKEYFANYFLHTSDVTFDFTSGNELVVHHRNAEPWKVTVVDTGLDTMTGGRVKRISSYIEDDTFFLTYGDGVCNININEELAFHRKHEKVLTVAAYHLGQRFGVLDVDEMGCVKDFREKIQGDGNYINIGYMICEPEFLDYIDDDFTVLEREPMERLAEKRELMAYKHTGFWQCMDTVREKEQLEQYFEEYM